MHRAVGTIGTEDSQLNTNGDVAGIENRMFQILEGVERNLNDLVQGLSLLGVKRCSHCKRFFRASAPGVLFETRGDVVCFECIPAWWPLRGEQLSWEERQRTEGDLVFWLRGFHNARSYNDSNKPAEDQAVKFELVASCLECHGTGRSLGDKRCRYCCGPGSVRIVVPQRSR